jgi:hypothetical protein
MKIDMSRSAVTLRLKQVNQLRRTCLALADSSVARSIRNKYAANKLVQRTSHALGCRSGSNVCRPETARRAG